MSLQERIFGLETEYAVNFYPANPFSIPEPTMLVQAVQEVLRRQYGIAGCDFLVNGGKFYHDIGHAEWSIPECRSVREVVMYDKSMDHVLAQVLPEAQQLLALKGFEGVLFIAKNNVDSAHNTYGCHENYMMMRDTELLAGEDFRRYMAWCLIPFLVTRQLFTGTGRLTLNGLNNVTFTLSQRAAFIDSIVSNDTRKDRSIINLGREKEPLALGNYRRLHLILGDSNLSGWATWMKLGTTAIVLRMIEDLFISDIPLLQDPVYALQAIARDPSCQLLLPLRNGERKSARAIQQHYFKLADAYLDEFGYTPEEDALMDAWEKALEDMQKPMQLQDRVDWVIKKRILDTYLEQQHVSWYNIRKKGVIDELQARDLRYHDISPNGFFNRLFYPDTLVTEAEIQQAQQNPPQYTRARLRGEAIAQARQDRTPIVVKYWMEMSVGGRAIDLPDPLDFDHPLLPFNNAWWENVTQHDDVLLRIRAIKRLTWRNDPASLALLMKSAEHDESEQVRRVAVEVLGFRADKTAMTVLEDRLEKEPVCAVRWAIEEALVLVGKGVPKPPPIVRSSESSERESPVHIFT